MHSIQGLLLKDLYQANKYLRTFLLLVVVFVGISFVQDNMFFVVYPAILSSMVPVSLISYDERSRWNSYSDTMPVTRAQTVSSKYLLALLSLIFVLVLTAAAQALQNNDCLPQILSVLLAVGLIGPAILLPFIFHYGSEKGRLMYYFVIGAACAIGFVFTMKPVPFDSTLFETLLAAASVVLFAGSWLLSIRLYQKREL